MPVADPAWIDQWAMFENKANNQVNSYTNISTLDQEKACFKNILTVYNIQNEHTIFYKLFQTVKKSYNLDKFIK